MNHAKISCPSCYLGLGQQAIAAATAAANHSDMGVTGGELDLKAGTNTLVGNGWVMLKLSGLKVLIRGCFRDVRLG